MSTIQIRIDSKTKKEAKLILDKVGLDMSTAIKVYLKQIIARQGIPFSLLTGNGLTLEEEQRILEASNDAKQGFNVSPALEGAQAVDFLRNLSDEDSIS